MRILISAYICSPDIGSEAEVGWQWAINLSKFHEIVVLTKTPTNINKVNEAIKGNNNLRFEYYNLPRIFNFMRVGDIRHFIYYNLWQIGAFFRARKIVKNENFDLVHHLVYVNTWQPTYLGFLGIPFIFGPIGENPSVPSVIAKHYGHRVIIREKLAKIIKYIGRDVNPIMLLTYKKAKKIIVINNYVYSKIRPCFKNKTLIYPAIGAAEPDESIKSCFSQNGEKFRALYVGRLSYIKCPDIALRAFLRFAEKHDDVEFIIIGSGPLLPKIKEILRKSPNKHKVILLPWQKRNIVLSYMKGCDVFFFPSCEGGGMVFIEAMSFGKPVICLNYGGARELIADDCGIKVEIEKTIEEIELSLAKSLEKLYLFRNLRIAMGEVAKKRFNELYDWKKKALWMDGLYRSIANESNL